MTPEKSAKKTKAIARLGAGYGGLLKQAASILAYARRYAARSVSSIQTAAYWELGRTIIEHEQGGDLRARYGQSVLTRLSVDLTVRFGRGFSVDNLERMRQFYLQYPAQAISAKLLPKVDKKEPFEAVLARDGGAAISARVPPKVYKSERLRAVFALNDGAAISANVPRKVDNGEQLGGAFATSEGPGISARTAQNLDKKDSGKCATPLRISGAAAQIPRFSLPEIAGCFPLPWSAYIKLLAVKDEFARSFYETEALRSGWTAEQLGRQIDSMFYKRTALSRNKAAMLRKGEKKLPGDLRTPEQEIKDPLILEFLGLKDEYSENDLEDALIRHLESFLLELGSDFAFVGRQKRLRIDDQWYRVDLIFFHRRLRSLILIDLKLGKLTHADAGQMHLYLNYARKNWTNPDENPPVGLILCADKGVSMAQYALEGLANKVVAAQYKMMLPDPRIIEKELAKTRTMLEGRNPATR